VGCSTHSLPAGLVVLGVEFFFLIKAAIQVGQGKGYQDKREHIGRGHLNPLKGPATVLLPNSVA